jgi:hypothetical protein
MRPILGCLLAGCSAAPAGDGDTDGTDAASTGLGEQMATWRIGEVEHTAPGSGGYTEASGLYTAIAGANEGYDTFAMNVSVPEPIEAGDYPCAAVTSSAGVRTFVAFVEADVDWNSDPEADCTVTFTDPVEAGGVVRGTAEGTVKAGTTSETFDAEFNMVLL